VELNLEINGIQVSAYIVGTVQVIKNFFETDEKKLTIKQTTLLSLIVAAIYVVPVMLALEGFLTAAAVSVLLLVLKSVGQILGVVGVYGVVNNKVLQPLAHRLIR